MAIANAYWYHPEIQSKILELIMVVKGLMIIPPWKSANGRLAFQHTITVLSTSAKKFLSQLSKMTVLNLKRSKLWKRSTFL